MQCLLRITLVVSTLSPFTWFISIIWHICYIFSKAPLDKLTNCNGLEFLGIKEGGQIFMNVKVEGIINIFTCGNGVQDFHEYTDCSHQEKIAIFDPQWAEYGGFAYPTKNVHSPNFLLLPVCPFSITNYITLNWAPVTHLNGLQN